MAGVLSKFRDFVTWLAYSGDAESACTTEDYDVEQGVGSCGLNIMMDDRLAPCECYNGYNWWVLVRSIIVLIG